MPVQSFTYQQYLSRQSLIMCFSRRQAVDGINSEDEEGRDASTVDLNTVVQSRTEPNDSSDTGELRTRIYGHYVVIRSAKLQRPFLPLPDDTKTRSGGNISKIDVFD